MNRIASQETLEKNRIGIATGDENKESISKFINILTSRDKHDNNDDLRSKEDLANKHIEDLEK